MATVPELLHGEIAEAYQVMLDLDLAAKKPAKKAPPTKKTQPTDGGNTCSDAKLCPDATCDSSCRTGDGCPKKPPKKNYAAAWFEPPEMRV